MISHTKEGAKKKTILDVVVVQDPLKDLKTLARTDARVFLLYGTKKEATRIMKEANILGLTQNNYVWIATQAVIGPFLNAPKEFPIGMLGVHFPTDSASMIKQIDPAMAVFGSALNTLSRKDDMTLPEKKSVVQANISCQDHGEVHWQQGIVNFVHRDHEINIHI